MGVVGRLLLAKKRIILKKLIELEEEKKKAEVLGAQGMAAAKKRGRIPHRGKYPFVSPTAFGIATAGHVDHM